jgi:hypothetical protein
MAKCIIQQVSNVVDDEYRISAFASAWFKVFSQHLPYISIVESLNLDKNKHFVKAFEACSTAIITDYGFDIKVDKNQ